MRETLTIDRRFCGPSDSGNGGYSCGLFARELGGPAEVTLRSPPPLDRALRIEAPTGPDAPARLLDGDTLVAEASRVSQMPALELPPPCSFEEATRAAEHYVAKEGHLFPECFVCGPARDPSDALCIYPGRLDPDDLAARAPWVPGRSLDRGDGTVDPVYLWAALDCPGYFGFAREPTLAVLGRMTARVREGLPVGTRCVVLGWPLGAEGRKRFAGSAIFDEDGRAWGWSRQVWVVLERAP